MIDPPDIAPFLESLKPQLTTYHWFALAVPAAYLLAFLLQGFLGRKLGKAGDFIAVSLSGAAAVFAILAYVLFEADSGNSAVIPTWLTNQPTVEWFSVGSFHVKIGILYNDVSALMLALVGFVTFLVHWYSSEYMKEDAKRPRYWAFLGLFAFSMTGIVLANSLFIIFIFWELVGFSSYLLIGFWHSKEVSARASQKAFLVNRIGDVGFVIALMVLAMYPDSFNGLFGEISNLTPRRYYSFSEGPSILEGGFFDSWQHYTVAIGLITGVLSKSAQFPLQVWLPDAMAGPTPVSSLLHAATMVAAGVYLLVRTVSFFPPEVQIALAFIGALTALLAALSALRQTDIKAVLAYSTISQLGFMLIGIGVGRTDFAFFHLITHAFFKCGLFLTAGAVIHQIHTAQHHSGSHFDAQDIRLMGGMGKKMRLTLIVYLIFGAALAGLPLSAGFLSKDGILLGSTLLFQGPAIYWLVPVMGMLASLLTAFYIARHGWLIFAGSSRMEPLTFDQIRRVNWKMAIPLAALALFSLWILYSPTHPFHFEPHFQGIQLLGMPMAELPWFPWALTGLALAGIGGAVVLGRNGRLGNEPNRGFGKLLKNHFGLDALYENYIAGGVLRIASGLAWFDKKVVDGLVNAVGSAVVRDDGKWNLAQLSDQIDHDVIDAAVDEVAEQVYHRPKWSLSGISEIFDRWVIDAAVNALARGVMATGQRLRRVQAGNLQRYLILTLIGILALLAALIYFGEFAKFS